MRDAVIVEAVRPPVGRRNGAYKDVHAVDLAAHALTTLSERAGLDPALVDDVVWGCVDQVGEQALNVGRNAVLAAGWPEAVPATTVDRQCGSAQQAIHFAAAGVLSGQYEIAVAGGGEAMTPVPMGSTASTRVGEPTGPTVHARYGVASFNQGIGAEMIAERWGLSREQLDEYSLASHEKAAAAIDSGAFSREYAPLPGSPLTADEGVRRDTSAQKLAALKTAFRPDGVVTAGNSSQISDGSAA